MVGKNGKIGLNGEHSWADAPVVAHFWEYLMCHDYLNNAYDQEGNCYGTIHDVPPKARKLRWEIPQSCKDTIESCLKVCRNQVYNLNSILLLTENIYVSGSTTFS